MDKLSPILSGCKFHSGTEDEMKGRTCNKEEVCVWTTENAEAWRMLCSCILPIFVVLSICSFILIIKMYSLCFLFSKHIKLLSFHSFHFVLESNSPQ